MVLRQIPNKLLTMEQLGLPPVCKKLIMRPRGLFLVTGPTGSGKTTTLASMINYLNENVDHHIITIEDPIEFYHYTQEIDGQPARDRRRRAELCRGHAPGLAARPRRDPGRRNARPGNDRGGHHAPPKPGTSCSARCTPPAPRARSTASSTSFPTNQQDQIRTQLSTSIIGVLSQALLPKIGGGRVAAYEMLVVTSAIANLIRENKTFRINSAIQTGAKLRHACCSTTHCSSCGKTGKCDQGRRAWPRPKRPTSWPHRIANAERGMFDDDEDVQARARTTRRRRQDEDDGTSTSIGEPQTLTT